MGMLTGSEDVDYFKISIIVLQHIFMISPETIEQ